MKKIVFATTNMDKVKRLKNLLKGLDIKIISLKEINEVITDPEETALTCGAIAIEKALHYVSYLPKETIVLTQDDTLSLEGVSKEDNPGLHIKEPVVKKYGTFTEKNAVEYYINLANKYGGVIPITFRYGHAVARIINDDRNFTKILSGESTVTGRLVNKVNNLNNSKGYFLAAIMQTKVNGEWIYWNELTDEQLVIVDNDLYNSINKLLKELDI